MIRGSKIAIGLYNETTYGQAPALPSGERAYIRTSGLRGEIAKIVDDTLSGRRGRQAGINGDKNVAGTIQTHLAPQSCLRWLAHVIGMPTTTGASAPYTHVYAVGDGALALPAGLAIEMDLGAALGASRYLRFHGLRVRQAQFQFGSSGFAQMNLDLLGADFSLNAAPLDASLDDHGHTAWSMFSASLEEGGAPISTVQSLDLTWNNDLDEDTFVIGGGGVRGDLPEGFASISGNLNTLFKDAALLNKAINSTDTSLKIALANGIGDGSAGNESFELHVPALRLAATTPEIQGPRGLRAAYAWEAHAVGTNEIAATATVKNSRATY